MNLRLERNGKGGSSATCGSLLCESGLTLATLEPPWRDNRADVSCVPPGTYQLISYLSPEHGLVYRLHNPALKVYGEGLVPEGCRFGVELHPFNFARESKGCIGPGLSSAPMLDAVTNLVEPAVQDSDKAMLQLRALLGSSPGHTLTITDGESNGTEG